MLDRLKVKPSYSRPGVSDDNPYSESLFRTKYRPALPKRFDNVNDAEKRIAGPEKNTPNAGLATCENGTGRKW